MSIRWGAIYIALSKKSGCLGRRALQKDGKASGGGFGAEEALEARTSKLNADEFFALRGRIMNVDDAALRGEIDIVSGHRRALIVSGAPEKVGVGTVRGIVGDRDTDFEVGTDGDVKPGEEGGAVAAKIFAGRFFFEDDAAFVAAAHAQRQAHSDSTFGTLPRYGRAHWDHGLGPHFW